MSGYKLYKKYTRLIRSIIVSVCIFIAPFTHAQEAEVPPPDVTDVPVDMSFTDIATETSPTQSYQITTVHYNIKGLTRKHPLSQAVPIDTGLIFDSKEAVQSYLDDLEQQFKNIRVIQSVRIDTDYGDADTRGVIPITLTIAITDTWNFIIVPYPSFDSNSGNLTVLPACISISGTLRTYDSQIRDNLLQKLHSLYPNGHLSVISRSDAGENDAQLCEQAYQILAEYGTDRFTCLPMNPGFHSDDITRLASKCPTLSIFAGINRDTPVYDGSPDFIWDTVMLKYTCEALATLVYYLPLYR